LKNTVTGRAKNRRKWIRGIFFSVGGLILLIIIAYFVSEPLFEKMVSSEVKKFEPAIKVSYSSVHLELFDAAVRFEDLDIRFTPDPEDTKHRHILHFQQMRLSGIHFFSLIKGRDFEAEKLSIGPSNIAIDRILLIKNKFSLAELLSKLNLRFQKLSMRRIELEESKISVDSANQNQLQMMCEGAMTHLEIDHIKDSFSVKNVHFESIKGSLSDISLPIPGTLHKLQIKSFIFNTEESAASILSLKVNPEYNKLELGRKFGYQADYVEANIPEIKIINPDWAALLENKIKIRKIIVGKTDVYVFRDRRLPRKLKDQPLPAEFLNSLPFDLRIDSLLVKPSSVTYEEFPAKGDQTGTLKIENMQLSLIPLLNHPVKGELQELHSQVKGAIMGSGEVNATISMPLKPKLDYTAEGEFNNLDLTKLNSSAEHLGFFHIESGILNNLTFQFHFNEEKSTGQVIGVYHDLVIDKLKESEKHMGKKDVIKSFLLQKLVIRKNKDKSLPVAKRSGKIDYKRDPTRFISSYLLKSLLSGVKASFSLGFVLPG
jgi:hypothetical protein